MDLPSIFMSEELDKQLMTFLMQVIALGSKASEAPKQTKAVINIMKWALRILNKYLFKYVHPIKALDPYFKSDWTHNYALPIWDSLVMILKNHRDYPLDSNIMSLVQKAVFNLLEYELILEFKIEKAETRQLEDLAQALISCLYLTPAEQNYFEEHPGDFVKNNDEVVQHEVSLFRYYTIRIVKKVTQSEVFQTVFLKLCGLFLLEAQKQPASEPQTSFIKEMVYSTLQICSSWLLRDEYRESIVDLIERHVCIDLETDLTTFLLVRLLLFLADLTPDGIELKQAEKIFGLVHRCLRANDTTIRLAALMLVERLLQFSTIQMQFGPKDAELLVDLILETIMQTENDILIVSLKQILDKFNEVLQQGYLGTIQKLSQIFMKLTDHISSLAVDDSDSRELEEKSEVIMASRNCMMLIEDLLKEKMPQEHLAGCLRYVLTLLSRCYERHEEDLLIDGSKR
jgi:hypothetical protein